MLRNDAFAGRPHAFEVAEHRDHCGLVDRHPPRDHVAKRLGARGCIAGKAHRCIGCAEASRLREPHRNREVVQRDHGLHPVAAAGAHHIRVVRQRVAVELPGLRLDACPLDREPVCVVVHRTELREVLSITPVVIDGDDRVTSAGDCLRVIGHPPRPVVVDATLHLMRCGGASQE